MEKNKIDMFKGARLGDKFKLSTGLYAVFLYDNSADKDFKEYCLYVSGYGTCDYKPNGEPWPRRTGCPPNIIGSFDNIHELDMEGIKKYAEEYAGKYNQINRYATLNDIYVRAFIEGYKASRICAF